jgi:hypothetical protein
MKQGGDLAGAPFTLKDSRVPSWYKQVSLGLAAEPHERRDRRGALSVSTVRHPQDWFWGYGLDVKKG